MLVTMGKASLAQADMGFRMAYIDDFLFNTVVKVLRLKEKIEGVQTLDNYPTNSTIS